MVTPIIIETGIYFGMTDDRYHADPALGSTDLRRLLRSAPDFWWHSKFNPMRPVDTETPAKIFGHAVHTCVLEGREKFEAKYGPTDEKGTTREGKAERAALAADGRIPLKREHYDRILVAASMIRLNPNLGQAFQGGMPEVSVFWIERGIRFKARYDFLKVRAITDLKSIRNMLEIDFSECCRKRFASHRFDMQAEHYRHGRTQMAGLAANGAVFGDHDPEWLSKVLATGDAFGFVYVLWQAEDAPITWSCSLSPGNPILEAGRASIEMAINRYETFHDKFGTDIAWILQEPVEELDINELPNWWGQ